MHVGIGSLHPSLSHTLEEDPFKIQPSVQEKVTLVPSSVPGLPRRRWGSDQERLSQPPVHIIILSYLILAVCTAE